MGTIRQRRAALLSVYPDSLMVILSHCSEKNAGWLEWFNSYAPGLKKNKNAVIYQVLSLLDVLLLLKISNYCDKRKQGFGHGLFCQAYLDLLCVALWLTTNEQGNGADSRVRVRQGNVLQLWVGTSGSEPEDERGRGEGPSCRASKWVGIFGPCLVFPCIFGVWICGGYIQLHLAGWCATQGITADGVWPWSAVLLVGLREYLH